MARPGPPEAPEQIAVRFPSGRVEVLVLVRTSGHGDLYVEGEGRPARWVPAHWRVSP